MMKQGLIATATVLSLFFASSADAAGPAGFGRELRKAPALGYIAEKRRTMGPFAHVKFCLRNPDECRPNDGVSVMTLTAQADRELRDVNIAVNRAIEPSDDRMNSRSGDVWQVNVTQGDCEDYALTKRDRLIALGWSPRSLRIAVAKTRLGEGHAVLVVKTSRGDLVLDNRTNVIKDWRSTDLRWVMIQSSDNPRIWHAI